MTGFKILSIVKIALEEILQELYFNIENLNEKKSFKLSVDFDGETVLFEGNDKAVSVKDPDYELYSSVEVDPRIDDLG